MTTVKLDKSFLKILEGIFINSSFHFSAEHLLTSCHVHNWIWKRKKKLSVSLYFWISGDKMLDSLNDWPVILYLGSQPVELIWNIVKAFSVFLLFVFSSVLVLVFLVSVTLLRFSTFTGKLVIMLSSIFCFCFGGKGGYDSQAWLIFIMLCWISLIS